MGIFLDWIYRKRCTFILKATRFTPSFPVTYNNIHSGEINQRMNQIYNTRGNDFINSVEMAGYLYMLLAIYMREAENKNKLSVRKVMS